MERIGIYGGTFNPPHIGHIRAAESAVEKLRLDKLLVIPSCISPHKPLPEGSASATQRLEMLQIALDDKSKITVSDLEISRGSVSYTYETVAQIAQQFPYAERILIMGTDMFFSFETWKYPDQILKNTSLAVLYRSCSDRMAVLEEKKKQLEQSGANIYFVENPVTEISSTDVRRMLAFDCADAFLPEGVGAYIRVNGLYGTNQRLCGLSMEQLEQKVISLLNPNRVVHVLGCRQTAKELAQRYGANIVDAQRAALLHDITKAIDGPLQLTLCQEYGIKLDEFSAHNPKTLHALTGSLVAQKIFGEKPEVVAAIASHTTGKAAMNTLEKIVYVADYMEPNRKFPDVDRLRLLAFEDLDGALRMGLEMTLSMLKEQGRDISPESAQALQYLNEKEKKGK